MTINNAECDEGAIKKVYIKASGGNTWIKPEADYTSSQGRVWPFDSTIPYSSVLPISVLIETEDGSTTQLDDIITDITEHSVFSSNQQIQCPDNRTISPTTYVISQKYFVLKCQRRSLGWLPQHYFSSSLLQYTMSDCYAVHKQITLSIKQCG